MAELQSQLVFGADHPAFPGHFPGFPIVPGVLLLDAALHAAAQQGHTVSEVASAKFLRPVGPGEPLHLALEGAGGRLRFQITAGAQPAAAGQLVAVQPA